MNGPCFGTRPKNPWVFLPCVKDGNPLQGQILFSLIFMYKLSLNLLITFFYTFTHVNVHISNELYELESVFRLFRFFSSSQLYLLMMNVLVTISLNETRQQSPYWFCTTLIKSVYVLKALVYSYPKDFNCKTHLLMTVTVMITLMYKTLTKVLDDVCVLENVLESQLCRKR